MGTNLRRLAIAGVAIAAIAASPAYADVQTAGLETNATATPLGIDDATPQLRWRLQSDLRGVEQAKYRVVVATTAARAAAGQGDVWDSGEVTSSSQSADYGGPALASRTRYFWSVRSWTATGATEWAPATWFETAYLSPSDWKGDWISGPQRTERPITLPQAQADDACCLQGNSTLFAAASAGDRILRVASVTGFGPSQSVTVEDETATIETVGTAPGNTTAVLAAAAGDTNLKVASVTNFAAGAPLTIGGQTVTITDVGTAAGNNTTLFTPAAAGDTNIKVASVNGFVAGQPALIDGEVRNVFAVGTQGRATTLSTAAAATDTNIKVQSVQGLLPEHPDHDRHRHADDPDRGHAGRGRQRGHADRAARRDLAQGTAVRYDGTGITLATPLAAAHAQGASARGLGTGITISPALAAAHAAGVAVTTPGSGITLTAPLARAHAAGAAIVGPVPTEFCRPSNNAQLSGHVQGGAPRAAAAQVVQRRPGVGARRGGQRARVLVRPRLERDDAQRHAHVRAHVPRSGLHQLRQDRPLHDRRHHEPDPAERGHAGRERDRLAARLRAVRQRDHVGRLGLVDGASGARTRRCAPTST